MLSLGVLVFVIDTLRFLYFRFRLDCCFWTRAVATLWMVNVRKMSASCKRLIVVLITLVKDAVLLFMTGASSFFNIALFVIFILKYHSRGPFVLALCGFDPAVR